MDKNFNFSGWATRNNIRCSDGRTIMKDAFKDYDGKTVPLVWGHQHDEASNILGHAVLENREEGVYTYGYFNDTENGVNARLAVEHGDITALSIYANQLKQEGNNVIHGAIREVSLVLAGANIGAFIDVVLAHSEDSNLAEAAVIYTGEDISLEHADKSEDKPADKKEESEETIADIFNTLTEKQKTVVYAMIAQALDEQVAEKEEKVEHADEKKVEHADEKSNETIGEIFESFTDKQKQVVYAMIGEALAANSENVKHSDNNENLEGGTKEMKKNVFEGTALETGETKALTHDELKAVVQDIKRCGTLKEAFLQHDITDIEYLFPEATTMNTPPSLITRDMTWVGKVMAGVHKTPFSRIKSVHADITEADARAKGYVKGSLKLDEVFVLLKRTTTPTTVYKKQKLERDDIVDITDFDVISWLKSEMRLMLDEELAGAFLVGDRRVPSAEDKIVETSIRPIWTDADLYTVKKQVVIAPDATSDQAAKAFIRACVKARKLYKGSGNPTMFTTEDVLTDCLLMEDSTGRIIYDGIEKLANALRVKEIVTVPVMEGASRIDEVLGPVNLLGIMVNLADYNVGADKGGAINMFDDFDIDYNAQKYLIETRCSGALTKPYSAIAFETTFVAPPEGPN